MGYIVRSRIYDKSDKILHDSWDFAFEANTPEEALRVVNFAREGERAESRVYEVNTDPVALFSISRTIKVERINGGI